MSFLLVYSQQQFDQWQCMILLNLHTRYPKASKNCFLGGNLPNFFFFLVFLTNDTFLHIYIDVPLHNFLLHGWLVSHTSLFFLDNTRNDGTNQVLFYVIFEEIKYNLYTWSFLFYSISCLEFFLDYSGVATASSTYPTMCEYCARFLSIWV